MTERKNNGFAIVRMMCVGIISAILLSSCGGTGSDTLEDYFSSNKKAAEGLVNSINGQFDKTGADSSVEIEGDEIIVSVDITELAKQQGIDKTNKTVENFKKEFEENFGDRETSFQNSLSGLSEKVKSGKVKMKVKILWEGETIFSASFKGGNTEE